jgi:hypothetical protein
MWPLAGTGIQPGEHVVRVEVAGIEQRTHGRRCSSTPQPTSPPTPTPKCTPSTPAYPSPYDPHEAADERGPVHEGHQHPPSRRGLRRALAYEFVVRDVAATMATMTPDPIVTYISTGAGLPVPGAEEARALGGLLDTAVNP